MKKYSQFLKELPSTTVVFAFGRFNPPTTGHELLVKAVKKLAATNNADHAIYASKSQDAKKNPLPVDKKVHYLQLMFPNTKFVAANPAERTFIEAAKALNKKYKNLIMVAGSDRIAEYERILNTYNGKEFNFDTVQVVSAGERDPDSDDATGMSASKMRAVAAKGDYTHFKNGLPSSMRDIDGRRLMNDVRQGMGLSVVKEQINLVKDNLREQYFRGEIFNLGDIVESAGIQYEIVKRGSNHLLLKNTEGKLVSKWIQDVQLSEDVTIGYAPPELTYRGYTTKNLHHSEDAVKAFQQTIQRSGDLNPDAVLAALKATDVYMGLNDLHLEQGVDPTEKEIATWIQAHDSAKNNLESVGEFMHHRDYWDNHMHELEDMLSTFDSAGQSEFQEELEGNMLPEELTDKTLKSQDKIKVARIIATMLGVDNAEASANPEMLINLALRKVRTKSFNPDSIKILNQMLKLADEVGIKYDATLKPQKLKEAAVDDDAVEVDKNSTYNAAKGRLRYSDFVKLKSMTDPKKHTKAGHTMIAPHHDDSNRRQRVNYVSEDVDQSVVDESVTTKKVGSGQHDVYWKDSPTHYEIYNADAGSSGHGGNMYGIHNKNTGKHQLVGSLQKAKKMLHLTLSQKEKSGVTEELEEGTFKYHMDKAIAAHDKGDEKKKAYHLDNARSAKFAMKIADYAKNRELLDKHKQMTEAIDKEHPIVKEYDALKKNDIKTLRSLVGRQSRVSDTSEYRSKDHAITTYLRNKHGNKKVAAAFGLKEDFESIYEEVCEVCGEFPCVCDEAQLGAHNAKGFDPFVAEEAETEDEEDISEDELDDIADGVTDIDHVIDAYDEDELAIVDDETGEEIEDEKVNESALMEVMSRMERMRAKMRFAKTKAKRERATKIALRTYSSSAKINKRSRRLAVKLMKNRLLRGRDPAKISTGEKERIERTIEQRKKAIGRLAMRLAPRVRGIEKARMSHTKFTKPAPTVAM